MGNTHKGPEYLPPGFVWAPWVVCTFHTTKWDRFMLKVLEKISPRLQRKYYDHLKKNKSSIKVQHHLKKEQIKAYAEKTINSTFYGKVGMNGNITKSDRT